MARWRAWVTTALLAVSGWFVGGYGGVIGCFALRGLSAQLLRSPMHLFVVAAVVVWVAVWGVRLRALRGARLWWLHAGLPAAVFLLSAVAAGRSC